MQSQWEANPLPLQEVPVCSAGPLADGSTQVPTSQRVDEQDDQENHLQQPRQCKHIHTGAGFVARKSSQHRPGFRLAAPASTATSGESSQLVSSPLVCWTPIRQHVTSPLVFDKHYHSLALHDKSVIQPLHHHHQQKSVLDFPREFWTLMRNDNPRVYIVCTSGTVPPQLLSSANPGRCFEQCHDRRTTRNPYIFSPHEVYQFTSFDVP